MQACLTLSRRCALGRTRGRAQSAWIRFVALVNQVMTFRPFLRFLLWGALFQCAAVANAQDKQLEYRLGAGDGIRITVFQNPDLTLETRVTENRTITYPLIGTISIGGLTLGAAEQVIANGVPGTSMPPWSLRLSQQERANLATYVRSLYVAK